MNELSIIRGLSLTRPWPFAFVNGPEDEQKRVENRKWRPGTNLIGCYVALHAAKSWDEEDREWIAFRMKTDVPGDKDSPHSEIFAVCRLTSYIESDEDPRLLPKQRKWFFGPVGFLFNELVKLYVPVKCSGARGLWTFDDKPEVLTQLRESYRESRQ